MIRRPLAAALAGGLATAGLLLIPTGAQAISPDVIITEVYGGGGNTGAPYTHDYVEIYNAGPEAVDVTGWSVQYGSASGTMGNNRTTLAGTIEPSHHYLVQGAAGTTGSGAPLPAPDATGSINASASSGKFALVTASESIACSTSCADDPRVRDLIGYGSANDFESAAAPGTSNTTAAIRHCADSDDNAADFRADAPDPQNSGSEPGTGPEECVPVEATISEIQGAAHRSPLDGSQVTGVEGVVTAVRGNGFWMQDPQPDGDLGTSDGVFVFTRDEPTAVVDNLVTVDGVVSEFRPGGDADNLSTTEITAPSVTVLQANAEPPPVQLVGEGGRVPPGKVIDDDADGSVETGGTFDATRDGIDFWESMEGMRVGIQDAEVVGPTNNFGELPLVPSGSKVRTNRGGILLRSSDANPERILLDDALVSVPAAHVGDSLTGTTSGVLDYSFGMFKLLITEQPTVSSGGLAREVAEPAGPNRLSMASFNVENLDPTDAQSHFDALASQIVDNLQSPDLLALEEIQDNDGPVNSGGTAADQTLDMLTEAVAAAGGPAYEWRQIDPENNRDGGQPGGNIRVAFMYRTDRGLEFVDRPGGDATTPTEVVDDGREAALSVSPGRIEPADPAWDDSRKPLVGEFRWNGTRFFAIANHFASKGGDQPLFGVNQPPERSSEEQRHQQAQVVRDFVDRLLTVDRNARVAVLGDINDFEFSTTTDILTGSGGTALVDLPRTLPDGERYTYVFEGNSQVLDHILLSRRMIADGYSYDVVHVNSEFADQLSDHEPQVATVAVPSTTAAPGPR